MKVQKLVMVSCVVVAACSSQGSGSPQSVADFIHDIDAARQLLDKAKLDTSLHTDRAVLNASKAYADSMSPSMLKCWPGESKTTATTDHACLDAAGYKR